MKNISDKFKFYLLASVAFIVIILPLNQSKAVEPYRVFQTVDVLPFDVEFEQLHQYSDNWQADDLPVYWRDRYPDTSTAWYRFAFNKLDDSNQPRGIYIWRLNITADIWLNGNLIATAGNTSDTIIHSWNRPLYFTIPPALIQENNELLIKHTGYPNWGVMEPVIIGSESYLKPLYEKRYFLQHDVMFGLFILMLSTGIVVLVLWFKCRQDKEYLWFAITSLSGSIYSLNQFIKELPMSPNDWRWLTNVAIDFWVISLLMYILRSLKIRRPKLERIALFYGASCLFVYAYSNHYNVFDINIFYHLGSVLLGIYTIGLTFKYYLKTNSQLSLFFMLTLLLLIVAGINDIVMQAVLNSARWSASRALFQFNHNLLQYAAPLMVIIFAGSLMKRFVDSINESDMLNIELGERIEEARHKLDLSYKSMEKVIREQASLAERERIYRDLHDDVGAKLLSLFYHLENNEDRELAKSALDDLRDIVSSKTLAGGPLDIAIQQWHEEAKIRVEETQIELHWKVDMPPTEINLSELQLTHMMRMLREAISNAIRHAKTITIIRVLIKLVGSHLHISISNNGVDAPVEKWQKGRGINNFYIRAREINGKVYLENNQPEWVTVRWQIDLTEKKGLPVHDI